MFHMHMSSSFLPVVSTESISEDTQNVRYVMKNDHLAFRLCAAVFRSRRSWSITVQVFALLGCYLLALEDGTDKVCRNVGEQP